MALIMENFRERQQRSNSYDIKAAVLLLFRKSERTHVNLVLIMYLVASPKKLLNAVANLARGLLNREKITKREV